MKLEKEIGEISISKLKSLKRCAREWTIEARAVINNAPNKSFALLARSNALRTRVLGMNLLDTIEQEMADRKNTSKKTH